MYRKMANTWHLLALEDKALEHLASTEAFLDVTNSSSTTEACERWAQVQFASVSG